MPESVAKVLAALPFALETSQAEVQGPVVKVKYEALGESNPLGYVDRLGFDGYAVTWADESKGMAELEALQA
eukprot:610066-Pleurochrysis_carterae.AAC.4